MSDKSYSLKAVISAVDKASGPLSKINKSFAGVRKAMSGVKDAAGGLRDAMVPMAAVGAAMGAFAGKAVKDFLDTSGALQDMSDRLGVSAEKLQEWQYVAEKSGVNAETMQGSMEKLNKAIFDAASGKGDGAKLFKRLGISVKDANGNLRNAADIMPQLADAFAKNEKATVRTAMAQQLMGKSGTAMIGVLSQGSSAIREQQDEARRLGLILSDADIAAADAFSDEQLGKFQKQLAAIQMTIGAKLIPVLAPLVQQMSSWLSENRVQIADGIARAAGAIGDALKNTDWAMVGTAMKVIFGGMMLAQAVSIGSAVYTLGAAMVGLGAAVAPLAVAFAPVLVAVGLLGAAGYLLWKNWDGVVGGLKLLWEGFSNWIGPKIAAISAKLQPLASAFSSVAGFFGGGAPANTSGRGVAGAGGSVLASAGKQNVQGEMVVRFDNAPAGMRVDQGKTNMPGLQLNPDVGYRSMAWG